MAELPSEEEAEGLVSPIIGGEAAQEFDYPTCKHMTSSGSMVECIYVAVVDGKHLMVFPAAAWHRKVAKRVLQSDALRKPTSVELACCSLEDRSVLDGSVTMKVWMGYVGDEFISGLEYVDEESDPEVAFVVEEVRSHLPHLDALGEAAREHFAFLTAESGGSMVPLPAAEEDGSGGLQARVTKMEEMLAGLGDQMETMVQMMSSRSPSPKPRVKINPKPVMVEGGGLGSRYPGLDPSVVAAAISAGVDGSLLEMQRMVGMQKPSERRMREPAIRYASAKPGPKKPVVPVAANVLSESEDEDQGGEVATGSGSGSAGAGEASMQASLGKLTQILEVLTAEKLKGGKKSKIDTALDYAAIGSSAEGTSVGGVKKAAAARRALRQALLDTPEEVSAMIERLMLEDLTAQTMVPGMPTVALNARAWLEHRSRVGAYKTSAYSAWSAAGILNDLINGRFSHARARAGLLLLMLDQTAIDRGSWVLSAELALEPGPPLARFAQHTLPSTLEGESPYSRLLDSRWAEVALSHLRDTEGYMSRRKNVGKMVVEEEKDKRPKPKPKGKPSSSESHDA